jgi:hypothetical protein
MNAVSSAVSWDATLRRLGFNPAENTAALGDQDLAVELDSTQRKRRKKMKKHKCVNIRLRDPLRDPNHLIATAPI